MYREWQATPATMSLRCAAILCAIPHPLLCLLWCEAVVMVVMLL
jgi:hypothetical protein